MNKLVTPLNIELLNPIVSESKENSCASQNNSNKRMTRSSRLAHERYLYSSFRIQSRTFELGDVVILKSAWKDEIKLAKLTCIYKDMVDSQSYADIKWFCTEDIVKSLEFSGKKQLEIDMHKVIFTYN